MRNFRIPSSEEIAIMLRQAERQQERNDQSFSNGDKVAYAAPAQGIDAKYLQLVNGLLQQNGNGFDSFSSGDTM